MKSEERTDDSAWSPAADAEWVVLKFGGTSVSSPERWETIEAILRDRLKAGLRPLLVHSALEGISDRLESLLREALRGGADPVLAELRDRHLGLARRLGLDGEPLLGDLLEELERLAAGVRLVGEVSPRLEARVLALGELMSTRLGEARLRARGLPVAWIDARELLKSEEGPRSSERCCYLSATCGFAPDPELAGRLGAFGTPVITQGFIARSSGGETVLLGRGGSDTSASYLAAKIGARRLEVWTDVPGLFSADPRAVPGARLLQTLDYEEAQEIASTGGSVLHPRCIPPVRHAGIPLHVKCTSRPDLPGTLVSADPGDDAPRVKAISSRRGITLVSMETLGMWQQVGFLADAFRCFSDLGLSVDLVSTSESNVTATLDEGANALDGATLERLRRALEPLCGVRIIEGAAMVSLVGRKIRAILHEIGPALGAFDEHRIHLVSQAASDLNLSFVVEEEQLPRLLQELHGLLVQRAAGDTVLGPTWEELRAPIEAPAPLRAPWWERRSERLLEIASEHPAAYVYDRQSLRESAERLKGLRAVDRICFAVKANGHPEVLREMSEAGFGFECVSPGEIEQVLALFPDLDRERILFTPNFAPREEYEVALAEKVWVTLDNLYLLRHWGETFAGREIFLRLDTGQGEGHHRHVRTAGVHSKFGIPLFELEEARELAEGCGARVVGLHAHAGSGILRPDAWQGVAVSLLEASRLFPEVHILDLGGGLGVPEKPSQEPLDLGRLDARLMEVREACGGKELWLEPGRYLVAEAGVLLATVTQTKGKGERRYVGVSTGMNSLLRPALYGAYHEIVNLSRLGEEASETVNVVGPICETGDRLGSDRLLPPCREGDVLAVANAGAYGRVMASRYNRREPAPEIVI